MGGALIMRRWLDPVERREIENTLADRFDLIGVYLERGDVGFLTVVWRRLRSLTRHTTNTSVWQVFGNESDVFVTNNRIQFIDTFLIGTAMEQESWG